MMDTIRTWAAVPEVHALAWALLHSLWQGAALALAVWTGLRGPTRSQHRYLLACSAMAALPLVTGLTFTWLLTGPGASAAPGVLFAGAAPDGAAGQAVAAWPAFEPLVLLIWLAGAWLMTLRLVGGWLWLRRRLRRGAVPSSSPVGAAAERLSRLLGIRRPVRLVESDRVDSLLTYGWWRPVVVLPAAALSGMAPASLELLLAHELIHIRRFDYLVSLLQAVIEALLFFNPFVWWISGRIRVLREEGCDDEVVLRFANPVGYARSLAALEELRHGGLALAASGGSLMQRIRRIVGSAEPHAIPIRWLTPALTAAAITLALTAGFACEVGAPPDTASGAAALQAEKMVWTPFENTKGDLSHFKAVAARSSAPEVFKVFTDDEGRPAFEALRPGSALVTCKRRDQPDLILDVQVRAKPAPENTHQIQLKVGQRMALDEPGMQRISVGNPAVADVRPVGEDGAELVANHAGKTSIMIYREDLPNLLLEVQVDSGP